MLCVQWLCEAAMTEVELQPSQYAVVFRRPDGSLGFVLDTVATSGRITVAVFESEEAAETSMRNHIGLKDLPYQVLHLDKV
jgi:hypothetical protein